MRLIFIILLTMAATPLAADDHLELLNMEERQWLDSLQRPLIVATEINYHPYNFVDEQGQLSGVVGDYMELLRERLGLQYEVRAYETFAEVLDAAKRREVDVIPLIVAAPERRSYLNFTQPAYSTRDRIFTRQETQGTLTFDNMGGLRVGLVEGYWLLTELERDYPEIDLVPVGTEIDGLLDLSLGRIDAFVSEVGTSSYYIQREAITNLRIAGEVDHEDSQTIASRSDWPLLNSILGKGLASITPDERIEIQQRWIGVEDVNPLELKRIWRLVGPVAGAVLLVLVAMLTWSLSLRRIVAARTRELEQELAERRVIEADKLRLAVAVEQSAEFVLVIDTDENIEYTNLSFRESLGVVNLEGRSVQDLTSAKSENQLSEALRVVRETGQWRGQVLLKRDAEDSLKVVMAIAPIFGEDSEIDGYVATARDVTKEEELEARVEQGERLSALGTLAGGIAHDFNNLLVPIMGYTDLVRAESSAELGKYLDGITKASERARDLVQRIMIFGRGGNAEKLPLDLRFEIEDSISFIRSLLPTTVKFEQDLADCGTVMADRTQIQQLLLNLCTNATDAMAESGGVLRLQLECRVIGTDGHTDLPELMPGEYAVLTVADNGIGMTEDTTARIFDPYFSAREQEGGTGLGLAIVHGIVGRHDGFIHVESTPGEGTSFQIFLPTVAVQPPPHAAAVKAEIPRGRGETVLLVDDDELVLGTLKKMLQDLGYEISAWSDPIAALHAFEAEPDAFDAVLADFTMPGMTGLELTQGIRITRPDIRCAILTGNVGALQGSDDKVISKPIPLGELAAVLRDLLRHQE